MTYYPIMRFARAELTTFDNEKHGDNPKITPIFYLKDIPKDNLLKKLPKKFIYDIIVGDDDDDTRSDIERTLLSYCDKKELSAIPTTYDPYSKTAKETCLRITSNTFEMDIFSDDTIDFSNVNPENKLLLIDFGVIDDASLRSEGSFYKSIKELIDLDWNAVITAGTVMPETMGEIKSSYEERERHEWNIYRDLRERHPKLQYGDYAARHPGSVTSEGVGGWQPFMDSATKIRYTSGDKLLILKGKSMKKHPEYYCELAKILVSKPEYKGENFSNGDEEIYKYSEKTLNCGNHENWIRIEHSHHIAVVMEQLSNLDESSG